ncbi:MAG: S53 family peptidase [Terracidiphilus sp.]|jgi:kumamolisin
MSTSRVILAGSHREPAQADEYFGLANPLEQIYVTVVVRRKAEPMPIGLYSNYMSAEEYFSAHGASANDFIAIRAFAAEYNLEPRNENAATRTVELFGTVGDLSRAFGVTLNHVRIDDRIHRVREGSITIPAELHGRMIAVLGLDDRRVAEPHSRKREPGGSEPAASGGGFTPVQVAQLYNFPPKLNGSGQTIAIIELDGGFIQSDISTYFKGLGLPAPTVSAVLIDGQTNAINKHLPQFPKLNADDEVALDIQVAGAVAPAAKQLVYFCLNTDQSFLKAVNAAVQAKPAPVAVSISWGGPEMLTKRPNGDAAGHTDQAKTAMDQALQDAANLNIPVFVATGDNGSFDGTVSLSVDFPASSPHAVACGGTTLAGSGSTISSEVAWNGSGGGVSQFFAKPAYQSAITMPPIPAGSKTGGRGTPDVCGNADPNTGYKVLVKGVAQTIGGTSAVAPLWAGLSACLGQGLGKPVGFLNTLLYPSAVSSKALHDITSGNNDSQGKGGPYSAGPGWDACTGLGSPNGVALLTALKASGPSHGTGSTGTHHPGTGSTGTHGTGTAHFDFPVLPPPVAAPAPAAPSPLSTILAGGSNSVALVGIVGLAAVVGIVASTGIVATVALSNDKK